MSHFTHDFTFVRDEPEWTAVEAQADDTVAGISRLADPNGRHVCRSITASVAGLTAADALRVVTLKDGSTIIWSAVLMNAANDTASISVSGLNIVGTKNTVMTIAFSDASGTGTQQSVSISGYTIAV